MTKYEIEQYGESYFKSDEFSKQKSLNEAQINVQKEFLNTFAPEKIIDMDIDNYVEGKGESSKNSFCYYLEFKLDGMGMMRGSTAMPKFAIYYSEGKYLYYRNSRFGSTKEEVFNNVRQAIINLIDAGKNDDFMAMESNPLSPMLKGKIYYVYYSDKALPIYSEEHLNVFLRALDIPFDLKKTGAFEKRRKLVEWKNGSEVFKRVTTLEYMNFLYSSYGFKRDIDYLKNEISPVDMSSIEIIKGKDVIDRVLRKRMNTIRKVDYEEVNRKKTAVGLSGEDFVFKYEKANNKKYSKMIELLSNNGDGDGYDIKSFDINGVEKHIEVKTCAQGDVDKIDFYLTRNEYETMKNDPYYCIYYVCGLNKKNKKIIIFTSENLKGVTYEPIAYKIKGQLKED